VVSAESKEGEPKKEKIKQHPKLGSRKVMAIEDSDVSATPVLVFDDPR
jgi:hypothetical protein